MSVKHINIKDLLDYEGKEGLILQGCGGDPQEWIDGINELFTKQELLLDGTKFNADDCAVFDNGGVTCILYPFSEDVNINYLHVQTNSRLQEGRRRQPRDCSRGSSYRAKDLRYVPLGQDHR